MPPTPDGEMAVAPAAATPPRIAAIENARRHWLMDRNTDAVASPIEPWIVASWQRCLARGRHPRERVVFEAVSSAAMRRALEANHDLRAAAGPVISRTLGRAMADTGYFALLTDADGIVIDVHGPVDRSNPHAQAIARVGVDLSEAAVGTTAIGAALAEQIPVWLHRGEHFFDDTAVYSCAGAPVFGPDGRCVGMLDLTGVLTPERRALRHLVSVTVRRIEAALVLRQPHALTLRLAWPGQLPGDDDDGLLTLDADGRIVGCNRSAADMLDLHPSADRWPHSEDIFAVPVGELFDAARQARGPREVPTWAGLRVHVLARLSETDTPDGSTALPLKDHETALIRQAVAQAGGNVAEAARRLGISRATVYRKLARR